MKNAPALVAAWLLLSNLAAAGAEPSLTLPVWPGKPPGETGQVGEEKVEIVTTPPTKKQVTNVSRPVLEVFRPAKERDTGTAVIVCPGGGFNFLMMDYEGEDCAVWLNSIGVTGIVLKYRVPAQPNVPRYQAGLQDAQRSLSLVRSMAAQWGIDPRRIGILGFSAGGTLAALSETNYDQRSYPAIDGVDTVGCRPDFAVNVYSGSLGKDGRLNPAIRVSKDTPPTFITIAQKDKATPEGSILLYLALMRAGVPAEMHIYADGEHGFGMRPGTAPHATWTARLADWMRFQGLLDPATAPAKQGG
jgi:acetyl esterase/lipase